VGRQHASAACRTGRAAGRICRPDRRRVNFAGHDLRPVPCAPDAESRTARPRRSP
jgi:hypothetical protein